MIRNSVKALIVREGKLLLNRCDRDGEIYFSFPGGGQHQYETLGEALRRECLEETGHTVADARLAGIYELVSTSEDMRSKYPDYAHKIYFFFVCSLTGEESTDPTEMDVHQTGSVWTPLEQCSALNIRPRAAREALHMLLTTQSPVFLGSDSAEDAFGYS